MRIKNWVMGNVSKKLVNNLFSGCQKHPFFYHQNQLKEKGAITEEEYKAMKEKIMK